MYAIHRSIDVSFAHHVRGHSGACINIHGHTWKFEVEVAAEELDREGFVVDFGRLRSEVLEPVQLYKTGVTVIVATTFELLLFVA